MSAGPDLTVLALGVLPFIGTTGLGLAGAGRALRGSAKHADWAASLKWSTAATAAGGLLIAEVSVRLLISSAVDIRPQPFLITASLYAIWSVLVGPGLLFTAFTRRARRTPARIYALQAVQLVAWLLSCPFTLIGCLAAGFG